MKPPPAGRLRRAKPSSSVQHRYKQKFLHIPALSRSGHNNAAKLDAADVLGALADEAGLTLVQMAIAFVVRHPAVTSAIIGPRTMEHLDGYLAADGVTLSTDVLDRIDQVVPPAATINVADNMWEIGTPALAASARRRP